MPANRKSSAGRGSGRQVRSGAPRRALVLVGTLVLCLAASVACVIAIQDDRADVADTVTDERPADLCAAQPAYESCQSIEVNGQPWRYALYTATPATSKTVVFDPGGPGTAVLSGNYTLAEQTSALGLTEYNLLVLEEPWVTAEVTEDCDASLTEYYLSARALEFSSDAASAVRSACDLEGGRYGFDRQSYLDLVQAITDRHALAIEGFVGHSFGSVRLAYLDSFESLGPSWAAVTRPFPVGASREALLEARSAVVAERFPEGAESITETTLSDRSLPVDRFDQLSAMIGTGYTADERLVAVTEAIKTGGDAATVGALSDQLWMRYGTDSLSLGMLAYWQELCGTTGGVPDDGTRDDRRMLLNYQLGPCEGAEPLAPSWSDELDLCVTASEGDAVAPGQLVAETFADFRIEWTQIRSHGDITGIETCLESVR